MELNQLIDDGFKSVQDKLGNELKSAMEKYDAQVKDAGSAANEVRSEVKSLSEQFKEMQDNLRELAQKAASGYEGSGKIELSAAEEFVSSEQYKQLASGHRDRARLEVKNTVTAVSGTTTYPMQRAGIVAGEFKPLTIREIFRAIPVSTNMVTSMRELAWTNSAAEVSQGATKPESDITFEQYNVPIQVVAHTIKLTKQLMMDAPAVVAYINTRLMDGLAQRIDAQLLNGNGTSPNLSGLTDSGNFTAYTPTSDDLLIDAINRAKYSLWAKGYTPDVVVVNPADWGAMERTRESGTSGQYLYGSPAAMAGMNPFGVRVVLSNNMNSGKFLIGAMDRAAVLYNRMGAVIEMGYVNDDFQKNLITVRAEEFLGIGVDVPGAILYGDFTA